ncbi:galactonate dehydratase [Conexibacter stalactiti]|uniref:Galactonate dehydratase n=1 Tax=Conexibacter stalactiti TaxID=1940611 RepID=A0ABU4HTF8_9ACTN|nr:galactonate dehydratase [Conexibacter stalactiti]MDW5596605.1 galactonate dehydratase [Conexibacter stalactiti]MEC5037247.1 galactonate dehydratase [Conexibacter stalactiti]
MKIARFETFLVPPRWLFLRVETDEGVVGWGEPVVEGRAATVRAAVEELMEALIGADPLRIEDHWQTLTKGGFYRGGPVFASAVAGIDQALWDIHGKVRGAPVHELLGGAVRERVRVYSWIGGDDPAESAEQATAQVEAGLTAVKMNATGPFRFIETRAQVAATVRRAEVVREALGEERDVALDFHGRVSPPMAKRLMAALEEVAPIFVEEPVAPELGHAIAGLIAASPIPIATGERLFSRWEFKPVLDAGVAVVQPDLSHAGGISEVRRIAALAETYGAALAPHCPLGPISLAASLQVAFATPNFLIQEQSLGIHYNVDNDLLDYLVDRSVFSFEDGTIARPTAPGLGIDVDEAAVREASARGHRWRNPIWRDADGAFTEW